MCLMASVTEVTAESLIICDGRQLDPELHNQLLEPENSASVTSSASKYLKI